MGGDERAPSASETTGQQLQAYATWLPALMKAVNSQIAPNELAQLESSKLTSPGYAELQDQLFKTFGVSLNDTGNRIADTNAIAGARRDLNTIGTVGNDLVRASVDTAKIADPEYYRSREALGNSYLDLLGNGANLTGGELAQIERGNRAMDVSTGNLGSSSASNTAANLATFGAAGTKKLNDAIALVTAGLPGLKSGMDTNLIATGRSGMGPNAGDNKFLGAQVGAGSQAAGFGNTFLGETGATARQANDINAQRRTGWDRTLGAVSSITGSIGNIVGAFKPGGF